MDKRNLLGQVKMSPLIKEKVQAIANRVLTKNHKENATMQQIDQTEHMLIKYRPNKECDSQLLNDFQISNLTEHLGSLY